MFGQRQKKTPAQEVWAAGHITPDAVDALGMTVEEYLDAYAPERVKIFIRCYAGIAAQAARDAGYAADSDAENEAPTAAAAGYRLMQLPLVREAIRRRGWDDADGYFVAKRMEQDALLTAIMRDEEADMKHRIRAAELLGKSQGAYIDRLEANVTTDTYEERLRRIQARKAEERADG